MSSWIIHSGLRHKSDLFTTKINIKGSNESLSSMIQNRVKDELPIDKKDINKSNSKEFTKDSTNSTNTKNNTKSQIQPIEIKNEIDKKSIKTPPTNQIISPQIELNKSNNISNVTQNKKSQSCENMLDYYIGNKLNNFDYCLNNYDLTQFPQKGKHVAVLLESRYIYNINILLKQISRFLSSDWSVILLVTENVFEKYKRIVEKINNTIQVKILNYSLKSVKDYNNILLDVNFWRMFSAFKKILIFQGDTMIYKYGIDKFSKYDYVGSPWPISLETITRIGNGGFSLRTVKSVIHCLENIDKININKYLQYDKNFDKLGNQPEDIVLSYGMKQFGYNIPDVDIAKYFAVETVEFNKNILGSHQLDIWNKKLGDQVLNNSVVPYTLGTYPPISGHRFGWHYVNESLNQVFNNNEGVYINTWFDCSYLFDNKSTVPKDKEWIGISHLTPVYYKGFFHLCNINRLMNHTLFINDLKLCKGMFTLSKYMKYYLKNMLCILGYPNIPVDNLYHPTGFVEPMFDPKSIETIDNIISIGCQLRKMTTIYLIKSKHKKYWLPGRPANEALSMLKLECNEMDISISNEDMDSVKILNLSNSEYDNMLLNSFIVVDLYDASANNALIECISRNIPCFISNLPAVCEYIGSKYPLLFNNLEELEEKMANKDLIYSAYKYLVDRPNLKERLTIDYFIKSILNSNVTKNVLSVTI